MSKIQMTRNGEEGGQPWEVTWAMDGAWHRQGDGPALPAEFSFRIELEREAEAPLLVGLGFEVGKAGHVRCIGVSLQPRGGEVAPDDLRRVRLEQLKAIAIQAVALKVETTDKGWKGSPLDTAASADELEAVVKGARKPRSGNLITEAQLDQVATIYRRALLDGKPPTAEVAARMNIARSTAGRWVMKARERGLLGPAKRGSAGEG